mmetsp:Transcript_23073/g.34406  ORF Transcript_23073/g.34406 Transcript_23073/m.34406 type:complete len:131 (-) Transcript_23073:2021-2413(-)
MSFQSPRDRILRKFRIIALLLTLVFLIMETKAVDPNSFANVDAMQVSSYHFDLDVNFDSKKLQGSITLKAKALVDTSTLALDSKDIDIQGAVDSKGEKLDLIISKADPVFGSKLEVKFPTTIKAGETALL